MNLPYCLMFSYNGRLQGKEEYYTSMFKMLLGEREIEYMGYIMYDPDVLLHDPNEEPLSNETYFYLIWPTGSFTQYDPQFVRWLVRDKINFELPLLIDVEREIFGYTERLSVIMAIK